MQSNTVVLNDIQQQVVQELDSPLGWHISWKRDVPLEIKFCV